MHTDCYTKCQNRKIEYPFFSVAIAVYEGDNAEWFDQALASVMNQTIIPNEIILVIDGPISNSIEKVVDNYVKVYKEILKVIRLEKNQGHGHARRVALTNCKYDLIAIMDADDISAKNRFEKQIKEFTNCSGLDVVGGQITEFIDKPENIIGKRAVPLSNEDIRTNMKKRCPFNQMTVMFKKSAVDKAGGYVDWYCNEDYYLWIRMMESGCYFANLDEILVNVRVGKDMYRRRGGLKYFKSEFRLQNYMLGNNIISPNIYIINCLKRLIVQLLLPNQLRGWVFRKFGREKYNV